MSEASQEEPTFRGFKRSDFGFDPDFDVPKRAWDLDFNDPKPEEAILAEYQEWFGEDGYVERSMFVDALIETLNGNALKYDTRQQLLAAIRRHMLGVKLPAKSATFNMLRTTR